MLQVADHIQVEIRYLIETEIETEIKYLISVCMILFCSFSDEM